MRPIDRFFSSLSSLERGLRAPAFALDPRDRRRLEQDFSGMVAPVLGASPAADLCARVLDRVAGPSGLQKLGAMAAFFLGEYDGETMPLDKDDWREIRETLEDVSGEMDLNALTGLMAELLSRGMLD
jgi:hypothetical protein